MSFAGRLLATAAAVSLIATGAIADPVVWTLHDVTFDDGGTASGSFTYDADLGWVLDWNIVTTAGSVLGGYSYHPGGTAFGETFGGNDFIFDHDGFDSYLRLDTATPLTNAGGTFALLTGLSSYECMMCTPYRVVTGGELTAASAPEPASWALMLGGFGLIGGLLRSRRKATVSFA